MVKSEVITDEYMTTNEAAKKWNSTRYEVAEWCRNEYIEGAEKIGRTWKIPRNAQRPIDIKLTRELLWAILRKKNKASCEIDLSKWGLSVKRIEACYELLLDELYLGYIGDSSEAKIDFDDIFVSERGIAFLRNEKHDSGTNDTSIFAAVGTATGVFTASFLKSMVGA